MGGEVVVNDRMQQGYRYVRSAPIGADFAPEFTPELTPAEMLELGVFCGKYLTDCRAEFPPAWFARAKLSPAGKDSSLNYYGVEASKPLSYWRAKGWIHPDDPRGWFQWYWPLARLPPSRRPGDAPLRARRSLLPPEAAPGPAAMGLRQPLAVTLRWNRSAGRG